MRAKNEEELLMKLTQWQKWTLCVCAVGGALFIRPTQQIIAATDSPVEEQNLPVGTESKVKTKRVLILESADQKIHEQQTKVVKWTIQNQTHTFGYDKFKMPEFAGYSTPGKSLGFSSFEQMNIPVTVYHVDYYPTGDKFAQSQAECSVDFVDTAGKIKERHVYSVPYEATRKVFLTAPANMTFVNPQDQSISIEGGYGCHKKVLVKSAIDDKDQQTSEESSKEEVTDTRNQVQPVKPVVDDATIHNNETENDQKTPTRAPEVVDQGTMTEPPVLNRTKEQATQTTAAAGIDSATMTEPAKPNVDQATQTISRNVADHDTMTELPAETTEKSVQTDEITSKLPSTNVEQPVRKPDLEEIIEWPVSTQPVAKPNNTGKEVQLDPILETQTEPTVVHGPATGALNQQLASQEEAVQGKTATHESPILSESSEAAITSSTNQSDSNKPSASELATLEQYNHPSQFEQETATPKNEKLPQTGDHVGQLFVACGIALLSILGLFRSREKH